MKSIITLLLLISLPSGFIQAADTLEIKNHWWHGKVYKSSTAQDWKSIGFTGQNLKKPLVADDAVQKEYKSARSWWTVAQVGLGVFGFTVGYNFTAQKDMSYVPALIGLGIGGFSAYKASNGFQRAIDLHNEIVGKDAVTVVKPLLRGEYVYRF